MLSKQDNDLLCQTGPGTPMGDLFRRFWLPALMPSELPAPDCPPIRFRILGEDLIAFRNTDGEVGFVAQACPHRGASLFFGRNEENGLRCVYHGWKFDIGGACVDMPSEPAESNFKAKVRVAAYPSAERGGLVWIYMGPREKQPPLPNYLWCLQPGAENSRVQKWMQESNYTQALEGNVDSAHVSFLHRQFGMETFGRGIPYAPPQITVAKETEFGFVYGARRPAPNDEYYWRITAYVLPVFTQIAGTSRTGGGIFVVPMDDEHLWWFQVAPPPSPEEAAAMDDPARRRFREMLQGAMDHFDQSTMGLIPGTFRWIRNKDNDYMIDRELQRTLNYTGLPGNRVQDSMVTEGMGPIFDRSREHLGTTDAAIIEMRRYLIRMAKQLRNGIEPAILQQPDAFQAVPQDVVTPEGDLTKVWQPYWEAFQREAQLATPTAR